MYLFFKNILPLCAKIAVTSDIELPMQSGGTEDFMKEYDVVVVGGGFSGVAAAISAARGGASVLLIEQSNCLGGAAVNCLVNPFMKWHTKINGENYSLCRGIFEEILHEMESFGEVVDEAISGHTFNEEYLKVILMRMVQNAGAEILLRSYLIGAECVDGSVKKITVANKSGNMDFYAKRFIDATGDADLAYLAGFETRLGRESDNLCQPMTLCFRISNVDKAKYESERESINVLYKQFKAEGKIKNPREDVLRFRTLQDDIIHFNTTRVIKLNPTDAFDITKAEIIAREQVLEMFAFLKNNFSAFKNSHLLSTAMQIGVRESRMICGEYVLTEQDLKNCTKFDDSVALGNYDIDIHNPSGSGTSHYFFGDGEYYTIPYRSLIPEKSSNLLVAGRCISATHEAQASVRIMPIVCCIGEAAGTAAAMSLSDNADVKNLNVQKLRDRLKANEAVC